MNTNPQIEGEFPSELAALQALAIHHDIDQVGVVRMRAKPTAHEQRATDYLWSNHDYLIVDYDGR